MKYTILINQAGIVDAGLQNKTDVVDWSLLDYIFSFQQNPKGLFHENKVWINYAHLISEMPLLGLNAKNSVANRVKKIRELGLIDTYQSPVDQKLYARTTELYYDITQFKGEPKVKNEFNPVPTQEHPVPTQEHPVPVEVHKLDNQLTNNQEHKNHLSHEREESTIFTQELPTPSANRPTVDKEIENLTIVDVVNYLAAMSMTLPPEEAQAFIDHFAAQGWYTNGNPIADWKAKARQWHARYMQFKSNSKKSGNSHANSSANSKKLSAVERVKRANKLDEFADTTSGQPVGNVIDCTDYNVGF